MKVTKIFTLFAFFTVMAAMALPAAAQPGPVVLTFMERVEAQTDASSSTNNISGETFLYSMVSAFRKLDKDVTGNVYYLNKYSIDDSANTSHIWGLNVARTITPKWKADVSYSHSSNPRRNVVPSSDSDRFSFGFTFKYNPMEKVRPRYTLKTTYSTGTDFSNGRTLSQKISMTDKITGKWSYNLGYTFVWGLNSNGVNLFKEHYTNQYQADFTFKIDKRKRVTVGYLFLDQLFHTARGDNSLMRLSYFYSYY